MIVIHTIKRPSPGWTPIPRLFNGLEKGAYRHSMPKRLVLQNSSLGRTRLTQNVTRGADLRRKKQRKYINETKLVSLIDFPIFYN